MQELGPANQLGIEAPQEVSIDVEPPAGALVTTTALDEAKDFLRRGWLGAAKYRFEDLLQYGEHAEAKAYVAWIDFKTEKQPAFHHIEQALLQINEGLIACPRNADFLTFRGMLLRLTNRYEEAVRSFRQALQIEPRHPLARSEKEMTDLRLQTDDWPDVDVETVRVNARIIIQRRIGRYVKVHSFDSDEVRIGSGNSDDIIVSEAVLPHIAKRHCTVIRRNGRFYVRRNASLGRVWLNGDELDIRKEVPVHAEDCIRLGQPADGGPAFEFRVFNLAFLHDIGYREVGGIAA